MLRNCPAGDAITAGHKYGNMVRWLRGEASGCQAVERSQAGGWTIIDSPPSFGRSGKE